MKEIVFFITLLLLMSDCRQNRSDINPYAECMPIRIGLEYAEQSQAGEYEYDSQSRVTKKKSPNRPDYIIKYEQNGFFGYEDLNYLGIKNPTFNENEAKLDSKGRIISYIAKAHGPFESRLYYDSDGYLIKSEYYHLGKFTSTSEYIYSEGNLIECIYTNLIDGTKTHSKFEYFAQLKNNGRIVELQLRNTNISNLPIGKFELGYMMGNSCKNLIKRAYYTHNSISSFTDYSYEIDNKGRVTKLTIITNPYSKWVRTFNYNCE